MSICTSHERTIGNFTIETLVYEDGYILATMLDQFGEEIASLDGTAGDDTAHTRSLIEGLLIDQHLNE